MSLLMYGRSPVDIVLQIDWLIEKKWKRSIWLKRYNFFAHPWTKLISTIWRAKGLA